jgi:signal transduction histidine kinase
LSLSEAAAGMLDPRALAQTVAECGQQLFDTDYAAVWLWDDDEQAFVAPARWSKSGPPVHAVRLRQDRGLTAMVHASRRLKVVEDYASFAGATPEALERGIAWAVGAPLLLDGSSIGAVVLACERRREFGPAEQRRLRAFAAALAPIAEALRVTARLQMEEERGAALAELMRRGVAEAEPKRVVDLLAETAAKLTQADYSVVALRGPNRKLSSFAGYGLRSPIWRRPWSMQRGGATDLALERGRTILMQDVHDRRRYAGQRLARHRAEDARTVLITPIPSREGLEAVLHVGWRERAEPPPSQIRYMETLAAYGGTILDNAHSRERAQAEAWARHDLLRRAYDAIPYGVHLVNSDGVVDYANLAAQHLIREGAPVGASARARAVRFETEDGRPVSLDDLPPRLALRTRQPQRQQILRFFTSGGTSGTLRFDSTPLFGPEGELEFVVTTVFDMTSMIEAQKALEASEQRLQELSRKLVEQQEDERRSLSLELHDEVGQLITAARYLLEAARRLPPEEKDQKLEEAQQVLADVVSEIRAISLSLRPPVLDQLGLMPALEWHTETVRGQTGLKIDLDSRLPAIRLHADVEGAVFRIVQESITNVLRHAPGAAVKVRLWQAQGKLRLSVEDSGPGFNVAQAQQHATMGLAGMHQRAENLGGHLEIVSEPGRGTRISAELPFMLADGERRRSHAGQAQQPAQVARA